VRDLQVLDDTQSTFYPVVSWSTVCLLLILTVARILQSKTIDFNNPFVQSRVPEPIYVELPVGYVSLNGNNYAHKVSELLYGDTRAAKL
jgi:hypothetical protein